MTRAIAYIRQQPQRTRVEVVCAQINLERQKDELMSHCAWFQLELCGTLIDSHSSPDILGERHGLMVALSQMKAIQARGLLINTLGDLTTNSADLNLWLERFFANGFVLFSGRERLNSSTPEGQEMLMRIRSRLDVA